MERSAHRLNLTPFLSLTVLPDVLFPSEKEQSTFRESGGITEFFFPPPLERAAEKFLSESQILEARALVFSQGPSCQGEKSVSKWCETLFW